MLPDHPALLPSSRQIVLTSVANFVSGQIGRAPLHVRIGVRTLLFVVALWLMSAGGFWSTSSYRRVERGTALLERWLPPLSAVIRLYRSMSLLAFYEHPLVASPLGFDNPETRQVQFRVLRSALVSSLRT